MLRKAYDWIWHNYGFIAYGVVFLVMFLLFVGTAFGQQIYIPIAQNNPSFVAPKGDKLVVTQLPVYKGSSASSFMSNNGLVWWIYTGFSPQECVPPGGVRGNLFWQRVVLTNSDGNACFDVTNMVLGDFISQCSSEARPNGFAYDGNAASMTTYGPGDFLMCHVPLSLVGPLAQNAAEQGLADTIELRPRTTDLGTIDWPWPEEISPTHHNLRDTDTFDVNP